MTIVRRTIVIFFIFFSYMDRKEILTKFGKNLRTIRLSKKLSQERLAELISVDRTYIGMIERGEKSISLVYLVRLMDVLHINANDLFRGLNNDE